MSSISFIQTRGKYYWHKPEENWTRSINMLPFNILKVACTCTWKHIILLFKAFYQYNVYSGASLRHIIINNCELIHLKVFTTLLSLAFQIPGKWCTVYSLSTGFWVDIGHSWFLASIIKIPAIIHRRGQACLRDAKCLEVSSTYVQFKNIWCKFSCISVPLRNSFQWI